MDDAIPTSDHSGEMLNAGAPSRVTYIFEDGHRRTATLTLAEVAGLRHEGIDQTTAVSRLKSWINPRLIITWAFALLASTLLASFIGDQYSDKQNELELEGNVVRDLSGASISLYQEAQEAARATDSADQNQRRDDAADAWVLASGTLAPVFEVYYPENSEVVRNWYAYQAAMYNWAVLGCCTETPGRQKLVDSIYTYVDTFVGPPNRPAPVQDPWRTLATSAAPDPDLYQWVGLYLLRGRGSILTDLREESATLD